MRPTAAGLVGIVLGLVCAGRELRAIPQQDSVAVDQFGPPAAPAFVLLGVEPTSVDRPSTPQGFALSVVSASNQLTSVPRNYAIEVAPYWLARHPTLQFDDYYCHSGVWQTLRQTLAISLATVTPDTGSAGTSLGLGVRALLSRGRAPGLVDSMKAIQNAMLDATDSATLQALEATQIKLVREFQRADLRRVGARVELAAAVTMQFPSQRFENGAVRRLGVWGTYSYQLEEPRLDITALARALVNITGPESGALLDFGSRLSLETARRLVLSLEMVERAAADATIDRTIPGQATTVVALRGTYRLAGSAEYLLGNGSSVLVSFGRDYSAGGNAEPNLIATIGLNLGFGVLPFVAVR